MVRAGWRNARWLDADGEPVDLLAEFRKASECGLIDRPIFIGRKSGKPLALRLVAVKKSGQAAEAARRAARRQAKKQGHQISKGTLAAAEWVILVTSLAPEDFSTADVLALYRLRWRIELGFKRLKSLIGLKGPPGADERSAKPYLLAHLLIILLLEPLVDELEDSPRWAEGLALGRLTRPETWRLLRQLVASLLQAIMPEPTLACLRRCLEAFAPTSARASTTKTHLPMHGPDMLAPMGCDPGAARPGWDGRGRSRRRLWGCESNAPRGRCRGSSAGRAAEHLLQRPEGRGRALLLHQEHRVDRPVASSMVTIRSSASWPSSQPWREPS